MTPTINLVLQLTMGVMLLFGAWLARRGKYVAHGICQTIVYLVNQAAIMFFMAPHFHEGALPGIPAKLKDPFFSVSAAHAAVGTVAVVLGLYLILAGWKILPPRFRTSRLKQLMRLELGLWWLVIALGVATFVVWNVVGAQPKATPTPVVAPEGKPAAKTVTIEVTNYEFKPSSVTIEAGSTVIWKNATGRHTVVADDQGFNSEVLAPEEEFRRQFDQPGTYKYFCSIHGAAGGAGMSGTVVVK